MSDLKKILKSEKKEKMMLSISKKTNEEITKISNDNDLSKSTLVENILNDFINKYYANLDNNF